MINLQGKDAEDFNEAVKMLVHTEHGRVFLAGLEKDLKVFDSQNRVIGKENSVGAAHYLAKLFEKASGVGYQPAYPFVTTATYESMPPKRSRLARILSALFDTER